MKFLTQILVLAAAVSSNAQSIERRDINALQDAAQKINSDFVGLDLVLNGTLAQVTVIKQAFADGLAVTTNQANLTVAEALQLFGPFRSLQTQIETTLNHLEAQKSQVIASSACKDLYTQLGLVWFFGTAFFGNTQGRIPDAVQPIWKKITDPTVGKLKEAYGSFSVCN